MQNFFTDLFKAVVKSHVDCGETAIQQCYGCDSDCSTTCYEVCGTNCSSAEGTGVCTGCQGSCNDACESICGSLCTTGLMFK